MALAFDVRIAGEALNDQGFEAFKTIEGLGLITQGFLWPLEGIWGPGEDVPATTIWSTCGDDAGLTG